MSYRRSFFDFTLTLDTSTTKGRRPTRSPLRVAMAFWLRCSRRTMFTTERHWHVFAGHGSLSCLRGPRLAFFIFAGLSPSLPLKSQLALVSRVLGLMLAWRRIPRAQPHFAGQPQAASRRPLHKLLKPMAQYSSLLVGRCFSCAA